MGKTKPENPGLGGRLNPGFVFEKSPGYPGFGNPGCKPSSRRLIAKKILKRTQ